MLLILGTGENQILFHLFLLPTYFHLDKVDFDDKDIETTDGMHLRSWEDFVHEFSTWSQKISFKFRKGYYSLQAFEVDHPNVVH